MTFLKTWLTTVCVFTILSNAKAFAYKDSPCYSQLLRESCLRRDLFQTKKLLKDDYNPYYRSDKKEESAIIAASRSGFFSGISEILKYSPNNFTECSNDQRRQILYAIAHLCNLKSKSKTQGKRTAILQLLSYIGPVENLHDHEKQFLVKVMDKAGSESDLDSLALFLQYGLVPNETHRYKLPTDVPDELLNQLPEKQREIHRLWVWVIQEVEKKRVSRWYFPGAFTSQDIHKSAPEDPYVEVKDFVTFPVQVFTTVPGLILKHKAQEARLHAQLIAYSLIKLKLMTAPIELPRSIGPVGESKEMSTYTEDALAAKFQKYSQKLMDLFDLNVSVETLSDAIYRVAIEMKQKHEYYDERTFDNAVARTCGQN